MDDSRRSIAGKIDSRRSSIMTSDDSTMYLSFDGDDKWQSALVTQSSQMLEMHASSKMEVGDDRDLRRAVLKDLHQMSISHDPDQNSPLRPFDKSVLNRHNALSSTPSKDTLPGAVAQSPQITPLDLTSGDNKENSQPGNGDNSTLSSSDVTANTVKANTLKTEDVTMDEVAVQEVIKPPVYPLSDNVVLENITEVSNEEVSVASSHVPMEEDLPKDIPPKVSEEVNEVTELIAKILKMTSDSMEPPTVSTSKVEAAKKRQSMASVYSAPLPRPRRSYLPTRMSVVVRTTLNSPAHKRRSCLPVSRRSVTAPGPARKLDAATNTSGEKTAPKLPKAPLLTFNCKTCGATFRVKSLLDVHVRMHNTGENGPKTVKRLASGNAAAGASASKNRCKYCDKNFALERALHIHLMENCAKIPPGEKRKLEFTELNHVKKAKLPKIAITSAPSNPQKPQARMSTIPTKAFSSGGAQLMAPPSVRKVPKNVAHHGVLRTPTKSVPCHLCKQSFKSILEFTNHSLKMHGKAAATAYEDDAPSAMD